MQSLLEIRRLNNVAVALPMDLYPDHLATWTRQRLETAIRRRVQTAYLGDGVVLARVLGRHKMFLRTSDLGFAGHVMLDGFWEMWLTQFFARQIKQGMTVVDVGANFGYYTLLFCDAVGESGRVIAVEPNPEAVALLTKSVGLNGYTNRTRIISSAAGQSSGRALLFAPNGEPKNATVVDAPNLPGGLTVAVDTFALDDLIVEIPRIDLVKIDAEGGETAIVAGMQKLIARDHPMIVLEFNAARYADPRAFLKSLQAHYDATELIGLDGALLPVDFEAVTDRRNREDQILLFRRLGQ